MKNTKSDLVSIMH